MDSHSSMPPIPPEWVVSFAVSWSAPKGKSLVDIVPSGGGGSRTLLSLRAGCSDMSVIEVSLVQ